MICSNKKSVCVCVEHFAMTGRECHKIIGPKSLKMEKGDIGTLRAVHWKDRRNVFILTNMPTLPLL